MNTDDFPWASARAQAYTDADDVYAELTRRTPDNWMVRLLAFAVFEERRIQWRQHLLHTTGRLPDTAEIAVWYASQPPSALARAHALADDALEAYGQSSISKFGGRASPQADRRIIREIQKLGRWWPQFGFNVLGGLVGSLVCTLLLVLMGFLVLHEPSVNEMSRHLMQSKEKPDE